MSEDGGKADFLLQLVNHDPYFSFFRAGLPADLQLPKQQGTSPAHSVSRGEVLFHGFSSGFQRVNAMRTVY